MESILPVRNFGLQQTNRKMKRSKFFRLIDRLSGKKTVIILGISAHVVLFSMMVITFPVINEAIGGPAFDLRTFGYTFQEANEIIHNLDAFVRSMYIFPQILMLDVLYPALLALFLASLLNRLFKLNNARDQIKYLLFAPFIGMLFDYAENAMVLVMITENLELSNGVVQVSSLFTQMKGWFTIIAWIGILWQGIIWVTGLARKRILQVS